MDTGVEEEKKRGMGSKKPRQTIKTMSGLASFMVDLSKRSKELYGIDLSKIDLTKLDLSTLDWSNVDLDLLDLSKWGLDFTRIPFVKPTPGTKTNFLNLPPLAPTIIGISVLMIILTVFFVVLHLYSNLHATHTFGLDDCTFIPLPLFRYPGLNSQTRTDVCECVCVCARV